MIIQACINGAREPGYHPHLPLTLEAMASDAARCIAAGAAELHIHPRNAGLESLAAIDETINAIRRACPGTPVGVSTGAWIENDEQLTRDRIGAWVELPDYASVNLSEPDAPAIIDLLQHRGIGVEAGLSTISDAERFVALNDCRRTFRILIEIDEQDLATGSAIVSGITDVLDRSGVTRPILLHGFDGTVWPFVDLAGARGWSTRVGLEDGQHLPDGSVAPDNAALVAAAVARFFTVPTDA
jgi:uncharacterized protein (DUF849 family)